MTAKNLVAVFENTAQKNKDLTCFKFVENGEWKGLTWNEVRERVMKIAGGLKKLGLHKGDRVCILSKTRYEWTMTDLGILAAGGIVVPIYESNIEEQVHYIIENSESRMIFVENALQYKKVKSVLKDLSKLDQIIYFETIKTKDVPEGVYSLDELMMLGSACGESLYLESVKGIDPEEDASFVYTSGTTGNPKGAILSHQNFMSELEGGCALFKFEPYFESLVFLPFSHILARVVQYFQIYAGFIQCYAENIDRLLDNIGEVKPHFMASVPRIFEKIHTRTMQGVEASSDSKKKIFYWAMGIGKEHSRLKLNHKSIPVWLKLKYKLAHKLVFSKLHEKLGGRILFFISGGAPLSPEVAAFFYAFGFEIFEGYGLTETTAAISIGSQGQVKIGTVGKPLAGTEFKIAGDGEILVKGKVVFKGYYKDPEATKEAIDEDGWFHTGDIGEFDEEGFLKITDRKKDIIVTAGGKNIAPQNIENLMKADPYISQFVVHGDKRRFLSALVTLDKDQIEKYADKNNIAYKNYHELAAHDKIYDLIKSRIDDKNKSLAKYESIKKFAIVPDDFTIETGELTPSLKVKRKVVHKKYGELLDRMYD